MSESVCSIHVGSLPCAACREDSIARRWATNAKACKTCGTYVLFRFEAGRRVALDCEGREHACDPATVKGKQMTESVETPPAKEAPKKAPAKKKAKKPSLLTYEEIQGKLREQVHPRHVSFKKKGGQSIGFMAHGHIRNYLDLRAPGWECSEEIYHAGSKLYVIFTLVIHASDRSVSRTAIGNEEDSKDGYGDPSSNASSMGLRRAAMAHGFCRSWWTGDAPSQGRR